MYLWKKVIRIKAGGAIFRKTGADVDGGGGGAIRDSLSSLSKRAKKGVTP